MKITKLGATTSIIYADEGRVLTSYTEDKDILLYVGALRVACANSRISAYREITLEQHRAYMVAKEIAEAAYTDDEE